MAAEFPSGRRAGRQLADLEPGTLIGGYRIEDRIGAGGMATVFRARDESLGRPVALKVLQPDLTDDREFRERFIRESRAASAVDHPNIIPVHAAGEDKGVLYLAMRYVAGGDLHSVVEREGALPSDRVLSLLTPIASALDAAHDAGIVHRDVKPANILIDHSPGRPDHPYLSDFGLAKGSVTHHTLTNTGEFVGTAGFASPEQLSGRPVTAQTDQYALACVAYTALTASLPFRHGDPEVALWAQMASPPPRVTDRRTDLFPAVDDVIARALSKDPSERYASCGEFVSELRQALVAPAGGGRLPARMPAKLPGRFSHQADQAEPAEPPTAVRQPGLPSDIARPPTLPARSADRPASRPVPAPGMVPLHDAPGQYRRLQRRSGGTFRRPVVWVAGAVIVAAVVVATIMLSGGNSKSGSGAAQSPGSTGPVSLAATLPSSDGKAPVTMVFGSGGTLRSADQGGSVSTFDLASQRATDSFSVSGSGPAITSAQFTLDGSKLVRPAPTCSAAGCPYTVSGADGPGAGRRVPGGPGPLFSTGNDTMATTGGKDTGASVWNLQTGSLIANKLINRDHGTVKALAVDPTGKALAVSSGTVGPTHEVYWWDIGSRSVVATETVPHAMGAPWASAGSAGAGLPMGLTGQTLALSDGQSTDIFRALHDQAAQAQKYTMPGGMMAISPDNGNLVATTDEDNQQDIDLWNAQTGQRTATLTVPATPAAVTFSQDGKSVAVGCSNGAIYVWTITGS